MTKEDLQMVMQFMQRVTLNAQEIPAFNQAMTALQRELMVVEKVQDPPEGEGC
jgi:hypothetical protein